MDVASAGWTCPADHPQLAPGEAHVWKIGLEIDDARLARDLQLLSPDERERADRFRLPHHRRRFVAGRAAMRNILSGYLDCAADTIEFCYNTHGKPGVAAPEGGIRLGFNLSNARELALLCISAQRQPGIDIEWRHRNTDGSAIAQHFFSLREQQQLAGLPEFQRQTGFLLGWTRKEAYLKARGTGMSLSLKKFTVSLDPETRARLIDVAGMPEEPMRWHYLDLEPDPDYVACMIIDDSDCCLRTFTWKANSAPA